MTERQPWEEEEPEPHELLSPWERPSEPEPNFLSPEQLAHHNNSQRHRDVKTILDDITGQQLEGAFWKEVDQEEQNHDNRNRGER